DALRMAGIPFVSIGRPRETRGLVYVDADLRAAAALAVDHLVALGHRHIAFLGDELVFGFQYHALVGFRRAHRAYGLPLHRSQILHYDRSRGLRGALETFFGADGPTALVTTTDVEAVTALHVLADQRQHVPGDVSLVTLGDSVLTELAQPPVTAVYFSVADQSRLAVDLLVGMMNGQRPARCGHLIPVHLTARSSTGRLGSARGPENRGGPQSTEGPHDRAARGHLDLADDRAQHMLEKAHHGGPHQHLFL